MTIEKISDATGILNVLNKFLEYMPRLTGRIDNLANFAQKLSDYSEFFIIKEGADVAGFISFYKNDTVNYIGFITLIVVSPIYRGKRFGAQLINTCINEMKKGGMKRVKLEVDSKNLNARDFYLHLGFKMCNTQDKEKLYMEKDL